MRGEIPLLFAWKTAGPNAFSLFYESKEDHAINEEFPTRVAYGATHESL
jgi:hypothetical protein